MAGRRGWRTRLLSTSLAIVMGVIFLGSWLVQSVAGWAAFNEERLQQLQDPIAWTSYLGNADFWARTLQNWQLARVLAEQAGRRPHGSTGVEG